MKATEITKAEEIQGKANLAAAMNNLGQSGKPFFFMVNFEATAGIVMEFPELKRSDISCCINGRKFGNPGITGTPADSANDTEQPPGTPIEIKAQPPVNRADYAKGFANIMRHIRHGDTYLLNYTCRTCIGTRIDLAQIYRHASARYKLLWRDKLVFFSPEPFIQIDAGKIYSFPMKGTISAAAADAGKILLENKKELYEHYTIVDLIRNDLSMVSTGVQVESFRYIDKIETSRGPLLQTSSRISGLLPADWKDSIGTLLMQLLPAGSISGAPKEKTVRIIQESETSPRGYYTGVMGIFDGETLDSCVIIRYIGKEQEAFFYRSGGGITALSDPDEEYNEVMEKIYVPV